MISMKVKTVFNPMHVIRRERAASLRNLGRAAGYIRLTASRSIRRSKKAAQPGSPPHTRRGQLRRAIRYAVERERMNAVVGPEYGAVGTSGAAHEYGGRYRRETFPKRPFMGPALAKTREKLPTLWANSIRS